MQDWTAAEPPAEPPLWAEAVRREARKISTRVLTEPVLTDEAARAARTAVQRSEMSSAAWSPRQASSARLGGQEGRF